MSSGAMHDRARDGADRVRGRRIRSEVRSRGFVWMVFDEVDPPAPDELHLDRFLEVGADDGDFAAIRECVAVWRAVEPEPPSFGMKSPVEDGPWITQAETSGPGRIVGLRWREVGGRWVEAERWKAIDRAS